MHLLALAMFWSSPVFGDELGDTGGIEDVAEYRRVAEELHRLAARDAWAGVERFYLALLDTGVAPSFADHLAGAHAAAARGEVGAVRERLLAAHALRESREVVEWLWEIDSAYGEVALAADPGLSLVAEAPPFDPRKAAAVAWVSGSLGAAGTFRGWLPVGAYRVGDERFEVAAGRPVVVVEARDVGARSRRGRLERLFSR